MATSESPSTSHFRRRSPPHHPFQCREAFFALLLTRLAPASFLGLRFRRFVGSSNPSSTSAPPNVYHRTPLQRSSKTRPALLRPPPSLTLGCRTSSRPSKQVSVSGPHLLTPFVFQSTSHPTSLPTPFFRIFYIKNLRVFRDVCSQHSFMFGKQISISRPPANPPMEIAGCWVGEWFSPQ